MAWAHDGRVGEIGRYTDRVFLSFNCGFGFGAAVLALDLSL